MIFRWLVALSGIAAAIVMSAAPASAHAGMSVKLTNYRTDITSFEPAVRGVHLKVVSLGEKLRLQNDTSTEVIVDGYEGEPYLRAGRGGAYVNTKSPAYFLNQTVDGRTGQPPAADAQAPPEWRKLSSSHSLSWHDHRTHWMAVADSPEVAGGRGQRHVVIPEWNVSMHQGNQILAVRGTVTYVPPVSRLPWLVLALVVAAIAAVIVTRKNGLGRSCGAIVGFVVLLYVAHFAGELGIAKVSFDNAVTLLVATSMGTLGAIFSVKRVDASIWVSLFATALVALLGGLSDFAFLANSQLPTALPTPVARAVVALLIGAGLGAASGFGLALRRKIAFGAPDPE